MIEAEERPVADRIDGVAVPAESLQVFGHDSVLKRLVESYASGKMHHAILLSGPRGIGKSSLAFNFAKHVLSFPRAGDAPLEYLPSAISASVQGQVSQGASPGLLHLTRPWDAKTGKFKSQLSVEEVRRTLPYYGMTAGGNGWRITIVDAADDMNASAANALLKILEEPPKRSLFLVITHSAGRLLPTIRSRCQSLTMAPLADDDVARAIAASGLEVSKSTLDQAIALSSGSVRKTIELLQGNVLKDYQVFQKLMADGATGTASQWVSVHKISENLSRRGQEESYRQFLDLVCDWIGAQARANPNAALASLAAWSQVWEKVNHSTYLADAYNLDKRQVILSLFTELFQRNTSSQ